MQELQNLPKTLKHALRSIGYYVVFRTSCPAIQLGDLNRKLFYKQPGFLQNCYREVMQSDRYGYFLLDMTENSKNLLCSAKTGLFSNELDNFKGTQFVWRET